ncbi:unnamed protein product [Gordionus sp. m RMFG-2023]|uniref:small ribosomal subunit protein eS10-like n=1 Tax=Gordionus sp. m RMFG-2023 TaxID=3053472 RepID=UPI0030E05F9A
MLMPKKNRHLIYEYLFKEGVMVAKKDFHAPKHPNIENVPNLQVIKALQSLKSRGYVTEQFAWHHYYWYLTNDGIQYLREYLHLPPEIIPVTLKRATRTDMRPKEGDQMPSEKDAYRKADMGMDKKADAGPGSTPLEYRGGFGRGRAPM